LRQIIYLDHQDHIATIRDKLERAQANEVILVIPPRYVELRDLVKLKLLKRYAQHRAIDLALVVRDGETRTLAREVGFVLTSSVKRGRTIDIASDVDPDQEGEGVTTREGMPRRTGVSYDAKKPPSIAGRIVALVVALSALGLVAAALLYLVLPAATITLAPDALRLATELEITAEEGLVDIDYGQARIPAQIIAVEIEGTGNTPTTGQRDIPDAHAEGTAVFANKTDEAVTVPQGTIVRTSSGAIKRFYTVIDVELPATRGAHSRVNIVAVEPGPQGNVKALTIRGIEGDAIFSVDVINDQPTTGGGLKRVSEVTVEDLGRAKNALLQRMNQEALAKLQAQLGVTQFIPAGTVAIEPIEEYYSSEVGDIAEEVSVRLVVVASGTVIGGDEANTLVLRLMESQMPEGFRISPETLRFHQPELLDSAPGRIVFKMSASGTAIAEITLDEVKRVITGTTADEAYAAILAGWQLSQPPTIEVTPEWLGRIPWIPYRITIDILTSDA
jgi:hypothetical protein